MPIIIVTDKKIRIDANDLHEISSPKKRYFRVLSVAVVAVVAN